MRAAQMSCPSDEQNRSVERGHRDNEIFKQGFKWPRMSQNEQCDAGQSERPYYGDCKIEWVGCGRSDPITNRERDGSPGYSADDDASEQARDSFGSPRFFGKFASPHHAHKRHRPKL